MNNPLNIPISKYRIIAALQLEWLILARIGQSRFIQSFSVWFVLVPIFAKLLGTITTPVKVTIFNYVWVLDWGLPFTWYVFFFASVFFTIGNIIYLISCPNIIKNYKSFSEFKQNDGSYEQLKVAWEEYAASIKVCEDKPCIEISHCLEKYGHGQSDYTKGWSELLDTSTASHENYPNIFAHVRGYSSHLRDKLRTTCTVTYYIGFILLLWVAGSNVCTVIKNI